MSELVQKKILPHRKFGIFSVSAVGYGAMGLSHGYGAIPTREESIRLLHKAYEEGCDFFDTAECYGNGHNEELIGEAFEKIRDKIIIATKLQIMTKEHPDLLKEIEDRLDGSLKRLRTNYVDVYYLHRIGDNFVLEDVARVMGELIKKGKIRGWGISQATEDEIRRAHKVTPLSMVQSEYSIMERMFEKTIYVCKELDIGFIPFSPMASGFLSGKYTKETKYEGDDVRRAITRFKPDNFVKNLDLLELLKKFAEKKKCTLAQLSLAWILKRSDIVVPIPGMRTDERIVENLQASNVELSDQEFQEIEDALKNVTMYGNRTDEDIIAMGYVKSLSVDMNKKNI